MTMPTQPEFYHLRVTGREFTAILAGLRLLENTWLPGNSLRSTLLSDIWAIYTDAGKNPLTAPEIAALCERLNTE